MPFDSVLPFTESTGPLASYSVAIIDARSPRASSNVNTDPVEKKDSRPL